MAADDQRRARAVAVRRFMYAEKEDGKEGEEGASSVAG